MSQSKRQNFFVIFRGPQQHGRAGTRYYANDGTVTNIKTKAAKFYSPEDAREFAKQNNIKLTPITYIDLEDFSHSEIYGEDPPVIPT
jgi:hypothetical protein